MTRVATDHPDPLGPCDRRPEPASTQLLGKHRGQFLGRVAHQPDPKDPARLPGDPPALELPLELREGDPDGDVADRLPVREHKAILAPVLEQKTDPRGVDLDSRDHGAQLSSRADPCQRCGLGVSPESRGPWQPAEGRD